MPFQKIYHKKPLPIRKIKGECRHHEVTVMELIGKYGHLKTKVGLVFNFTCKTVNLAGLFPMSDPVYSFSDVISN